MKESAARVNTADAMLKMTPGEFIGKWRASSLKERSGSQEHFIDLCRLLGEPTPAEADPSGEHYCFERGPRRGRGCLRERAESYGKRSNVWNGAPDRICLGRVGEVTLPTSTPTSSARPVGKAPM